MIGMTFESVLYRLLLSDSPLDKGFNSFRNRRSDIFSEIDALRPATLLKRDSNKAVFL